MRTDRQRGFAAFELIVVAVLLAVVAGSGYLVYKQHHKPTATVSTTNSNGAHSTGSSVPTAPQIKTSSDLNTALQDLNQVNLNAGSTDSMQLNSQTNAF